MQLVVMENSVGCSLALKTDGGGESAAGGSARLLGRRRCSRVQGGAVAGGVRLGHMGTPVVRFIGAGREGQPVARTPGRRRRRRVRHGHHWPMGFNGLRWAPRGPTAGPVRTWDGPSGSTQLDRICFFRIYF
jgi:hypothetical protein